MVGLILQKSIVVIVMYVVYVVYQMTLKPNNVTKENVDVMIK